MVLRREIQKHEFLRSLESLLLRIPLLVRTLLDTSKIGSPVLFIILIQELRKRHDVATLGRSLTLTSVDRTSRRCNVTTLERRDVATSRRWNVATLQRHDAGTSRRAFTSSSSHFQKASETHHVHLQCSKDPKIIYQAIMHLLIYKIELKRNKDAGMT